MSAPMDDTLGVVRSWSIRDAGTHFYVRGYIGDTPFVSKPLKRVSAAESRFWTEDGCYELEQSLFPFEIDHADNNL